jgi:hypothetical protein
MVHWHMMHSQSRKEALLCDQLLIYKIEAYLPSVSLKPVNPRSRKEQPYFQVTCLSGWVWKISLFPICGGCLSDDRILINNGPFADYKAIFDYRL